MSLQEYIDQEKKEWALQDSAKLLMIKIKMMECEFFHEVDKIQEAA